MHVFFGMQNSIPVKSILLVASSMTVMAGAIVSPALVGIDRHFAGHSEDAIKLVLTIPALMIALFGLPMGYLADRFGRTRLLAGALLLYGTAGFAGFLLDDFVLLLVSRALLGVAVAGIMGVSTTLIGDYFQGSARNRFLGTQGSFMALGGIVFLNLGGALAEWSWRGPFLVYLLGFAMAPLALAVLREPPPHVPGGNGGNPAGPQRIERFKTALAFALGLVSMLLFYMIPAQLPFLLDRSYDAGSLETGMAISVATLTSAAVSFNYGRFRQRLPVMALYVLSFLLIGAGYGAIGLADSFSLTVLGIGISGMGFGFMLPNGNVWLMSITPAAARGRIIGAFSAMVFLGQFLSPLAVAPLIGLLHSLEAVYVAAALFALLLAGLLALPGRFRERASGGN